MVFDYPSFNSALIQGTNSFQEGQGKAKDRVIINVGGKRHETYISTIRNFPDTRLYWIAETAAKMVDFDPERNEFFFDRHPGCFENILNYCRTGKLHCPNDVCGPLFEEELAFWGIDELQMEPCCWGTYTQHRNAHKHLRMFDKIRTDGFEEEEEGEIEGRVGPVRSYGPIESFFRYWRPIVWSTLERPYSSNYAQVVALVNLLVIVLSIASFCIETMQFAQSHGNIFKVLEYFYCAFFTIDFLIRLFCCPNIIKFFQGPMTWIDLASIVQFYINFFANSKVLDFLFVLRLVRIFRLFRFFKNLSGMQVIGQTLKASARELFLLVLIVLIPMVIFSTLAYFAEQQAKLSTFNSIPETFWWAIITMTTVGYGDVTPKSLAGKVVGALCACSGVLILALPVSVIGSNFTLYYSYAQARLRLPKRKQPALVMADKALVNAKIEQRDAEQSANGSEMSDDDKKTPRMRRQAISVASSGLSATSTPRFGKKSGMVSSGLSGLAAVMVEMTVPTQRRMALTPSSCPIKDQSDAHKANSKSASTLSSGEILKEAPFEDTGKPPSTYGSLDSRKKFPKRIPDQPILEVNTTRDKGYRLNSSPNLSLLDDRRGSDVVRNQLAPKDAVLSVEADGSIDGAHLFSNYDRTCHSSGHESNTSEDGILGAKPNKSKRKKKRDKSSNNLCTSERNISATDRKGSMPSPFLKRLVGFGRSRSNKGLSRTDSSDSDKLLQMVNSTVPGKENCLNRQDSSINILITGADSENDANDNVEQGSKMLSNGRRIFGHKPKSSTPMLQTPSHDRF